MPELAEVEIIRTQLESLLGLELVDGWARLEPKWASAALARGVLRGVRRRGKFLLVDLDDHGDLRVLVVHLGMTGKLLVQYPTQTPPTHVCARWDLSDTRTLYLCDVRRFGRAVLSTDGSDAMPQMGLDALHATPQQLSEALAKRRQGFKALVLSQKAVCGVGNYLVDEASWLSGIHPEAREVSLERTRHFAVELRRLIRRSIRAGGATLRDYVSLDGPGRTQELLRCYGHGGEPCDLCGTTLQVGVVAGRTTTWCGTCQQR